MCGNQVELAYLSLVFVFDYPLSVVRGFVGKPTFAEMETEGNFVFLSSSILIAVFFGGAVLVLMYILKVMRLEKPQPADDEKSKRPCVFD